MKKPIIRVALITAALLMIPAVAMQFTKEVVWGPFDFAVAGALLFGTGLAFEVALKKANNLAYRAAAGLALFAALFLIWANLAVGVIGDEGNPANAMYLGVLAVGIIGAAVARLQPQGMARALFATAVAQMLAGAIAMAFRLGDPIIDTPLKTLAVNGMFVVLFGGAALLFRYSVRTQAGGKPQLAG